MTIQELVQGYRKNNPDGHYFDKATLRFFGERIDEMELIPLAGGDEITDRFGNRRKVWCLRAVSHNAPAGSTAHYTYFYKKTFEEVEPKWRTRI